MELHEAGEAKKAPSMKRGDRLPKAIRGEKILKLPQSCFA